MDSETCQKCGAPRNYMLGGRTEAVFDCGTRSRERESTSPRTALERIARVDFGERVSVIREWKGAK